MIEIKTKARKWGNSIGISLPKDVIDMANIKLNEDIKILIKEKSVDLNKAFGSLKITTPTQKILDRIREGEN